MSNRAQIRNRYGGGSFGRMQPQNALQIGFTPRGSLIFGRIVGPKCLDVLTGDDAVALEQPLDRVPGAL